MHRTLPSKAAGPFQIHLITDEVCLAYHRPDHPERPERVRATIDRLRRQDELSVAWVKPTMAPRQALLRAHSARHLARLEQTVDFDGDTPSHPGILDHAVRSAGGALRALDGALKGRVPFSLLRPPGHHAEQERAMGFCYLNSVAISVLEALARGVGKVAVYDFDLHHGNGTQSILQEHPQVRFVSIHQHPGYPGTGGESSGNCFNYPMPPHSPRKTYQDALSRGIEKIQRWKPELVAVSAGFDAFRGDPIGAEALEAEDYHWLGQCLRDTAIPTFSVLEGGYSDELPELILAYLKGLAEA
jgi:acetoin utilization deacetylase AcuC-like enzyme